MSDDIETTEAPGFDRRRFIKASAGGAALVWAAPTITGLNARAFAAGSEACLSGFNDAFEGEPTGAPGSQYNTVGDLTNFSLSGGNVDIIGYSAPYIYFGGTEGKYVDLDGTGNPGPSVTLTSKTGFCKGTYTVTIRVAGNQRSQQTAPDVVSASLGAGSNTVSLDSTDGPTSLSFVAVVSTNGEKLTITQTPAISTDNQGAILLEVTVS